MTWLSWAVVLAALFAAATNVRYMIRCPNGAKFWLRFFNAVVVLYFGFLYVLLGLEIFDLPSLGPILIRPGIFVLLMLIAADPLADCGKR